MNRELDVMKFMLALWLSTSLLCAEPVCAADGLHAEIKSLNPNGEHAKTKSIYYYRLHAAAQQSPSNSKWAVSMEQVLKYDPSAPNWIDAHLPSTNSQVCNLTGVPCFDTYGGKQHHAVFIQDVGQQGFAHEIGLQWGDIILSVNDHAVESPYELDWLFLHNTDKSIRVCFERNRKIYLASKSNMAFTKNHKNIQ